MPETNQEISERVARRQAEIDRIEAKAAQHHATAAAIQEQLDKLKEVNPTHYAADHEKLAENILNAKQRGDELAAEASAMRERMFKAEPMRPLSPTFTPSQLEAIEKAAEHIRARRAAREQERQRDRRIDW